VLLKKMRVLLINQYYPPDTAATGQLLADVANGLTQSGHEVHVLCSKGGYDGCKIETKKTGSSAFLSNSCDYDSHKPGKIHIHRICATSFGHRKLSGRLIDYFSFFIMATIKAIRLPKMDICMTMTTPPYISITGYFLKRLFGTRLVLWIMDLYPDIAVAYGAIKNKGLIHRGLTRLKKKIYHEASAIISIGELMTEKLEAAGAERNKIVTIDNWWPAENIMRLRHNHSAWEKYPNSSKKITIMYCGNYGPGHDLSTLIEAMQKEHIVNSVRILFVSNQKGRQRFKKLISRFDLTDVELLESVSLEELPDMLERGDIHLVSQSYKTEGLMVPSKLYGIMAMGKAIIFVGSINTEAAKIISQSGCGFIITPRGVEQARKALWKLTSDKELRISMGKQGRRYYEDYFGLNRSANRIIEVLEILILQNTTSYLNPTEQHRDDCCDASTLPAIQPNPLRRRS